MKHTDIKLFSHCRSKLSGGLIITVVKLRVGVGCVRVCVGGGVTGRAGARKRPSGAVQFTGEKGAREIPREQCTGGSEQRTGRGEGAVHRGRGSREHGHPLLNSRYPAEWTFNEKVSGILSISGHFWSS